MFATWIFEGGVSMDYTLSVYIYICFFLYVQIMWECLSRMVKGQGLWYCRVLLCMYVLDSEV